MRIEHVDRYDGNFVWLKLVGDDGASVGSVGMVLPRAEEYDFPASTRGEKIQVTSGVVTINGVDYRAFGKPCVIKQDEEVHITVRHQPATYRCTHGE